MEKVKMVFTQSVYQSGTYSPISSTYQCGIYQSGTSSPISDIYPAGLAVYLAALLAPVHPSGTYQNGICQSSTYSPTSGTYHLLTYQPASC